MTQANINNRKDILLLLLYSPGVGDFFNEPIVGRTRLVKMLFLFKEEALAQFKKGTLINDDNFYHFFPWNFGPFSRQAYDDLMFFILRGFISEGESEQDALPESAAEWEMWLSSSEGEEQDSGLNMYEDKSFSLTARGVQFAEGLYSDLSGNQRKLLKEFKKRLNGIPLRSILKYVYATYPDLTSKSTIRNQVLGPADI